MSGPDWLKHLSDPALIVDSSGKVVQMNGAAELELPRTDSELVPPPFSPAARAALAGVREPAELQLEVASGAKSSPRPCLAFPLSDSRLLIILRPAPNTAGQEDFLAAAAHDLKNPISAVFGYTEALLETSVGADLSARHRGIINRIRSTARRMFEVVANYELLFQLEAGALPHPQSDSVDLNAVIRSVLEYAGGLVPERAPIRTELDSAEILIAAERPPLERILENIISNALKFTPVEGAIVVRSSLANDRAYVAVTNSAPIIPAAELPGLFDRYRRGSTRGTAPGSGLGLYLVRKTTLWLGGTVEVSSAAGAGTTFTLSFPRFVSPS